jgi:hypothetical protein
MGLTAAIDALDTALAVRGLAGLQRVRTIQAHGGELWQGATREGSRRLKREGGYPGFSCLLTAA